MYARKSVQKLIHDYKTYELSFYINKKQFLVVYLSRVCIANNKLFLFNFCKEYIRFYLNLIATERKPIYCINHYN